MRVEREHPGKFMEARASWEDARLALLGVPLDLTASFRAGAGSGPQSVRQQSWALETYSPALDRDLSQVQCWDGGDLLLPPGRSELGVSLITQAVGECLAGGRFPLLLGGEHLLTLGAVEAAREYARDLVVLQYDAHADLCYSYGGQLLTHATVMRRVAERVGPSNLLQAGLRSGSREEWEYARTHTRVLGEELGAATARALEIIGHRPVYVTVDIDVVDPAFAPGTGSPEPGGPPSACLLAALQLLEQAWVVGMDVVEVAPAYDRGGITSLLAARVAREAMLMFGRAE